jgi:hypothetical protein
VIGAVCSAPHLGGVPHRYTQAAKFAESRQGRAEHRADPPSCTQRRADPVIMVRVLARLTLVGVAQGFREGQSDVRSILHQLRLQFEG